MAADSSADATAKKLLVIDTDCGVDDAEALFLALAPNVNCEVLAITCVGGNTSLDNVCGNVLRVLKLCRKEEIPVYRGSSSGFLYPNDSSAYIHMHDGFGGIAHTVDVDTTRLQEEHAAVALYKLAKARPKQITLVTLGPVTNVAIAHRMFPEFHTLLKDICLMGGNVQGRGNRPDMFCAEYNFASDPEGVDIILREFGCSKLIVPWETCITNRMTWEWWSKLMSANSIKADFINRLTCEVNKHRQKTSGHAPGYYSCDMMAMACFLDHSCVKTSSDHFMAIELAGKWCRGTMAHDWRHISNKKPNATVVTEFNIEAMEKLCSNIIL